MSERNEDMSAEDVAAGSASAEREGPAEREGERIEAEQGGKEPPFGLEPLLPVDEGNDFRNRWEVVQAGFVDRPRESVEQADNLVASLMERLAGSFSERRDQLEEQWARGDEASTEDLRIALQGYRSFFDRLLRT